MKFKSISFLAILALTACSSSAPLPPTPCYTCANPPNASYYGTTYHCTADNIYRYDTNYPYGRNTSWYSGTCIDP